MKESIIKKLENLKERHEEIAAELSDADVIKLFRKHTFFT